MTFLMLSLLLIIVLLGIKSIRLPFITQPLFSVFKKKLPSLSPTEKQAIEAGGIWWESELFRGKPNWNTLHSYGNPTLTDEEKVFIDNQLVTALKMIDDFDIVQQHKALPEELWNYFKKEGFLGLIIPKEYGGKGFSSYANSTIISKLASRSVSVAVSVMVPNSLGPSELLNHYGTKEQREYWLPLLANGEAVPCFALTAPEAGSDAGAIPDEGVVCRKMVDGESVLGINLNWNKRYITLAPIATVLGLAFQLRDPDGLLGEDSNRGITCALIPTKHKGVKIGHRHNPLNMAFMNGTTQGKDVFIPIDWIIGGQQYAGCGWRMLIECLSTGRGVSLPALATASGHLATKTTTAYCYIRHQFGMPIGQFEGVQEALARIITNSYQLEAARRLTSTGIDLNVKPSVVTAIAKYHMTEMGRAVINDAMDIHSGKGIQLGSKNYLGHHYMATPISITVEGANILTRSLMIFGQGATRCHPYLLAEMEAAAMDDQIVALEQFDSLLIGHIGYVIRNGFSALMSSLTGSRFNSSPVKGSTRQYYKDMSRISAALAFVTDFSALIIGGNLKRKEMLSARLGDVLSELYLGSATLKLFEDNGRQQDELSIVHYVMQTRLQKAALALQNAIRNFPNRPVAWFMRAMLFPLGNHFNGPKDKLAISLCNDLLKPSSVRDRLTFLCPDLEGDKSGIADVERAFLAQYRCASLYKKIKQAQQEGRLPTKIQQLKLVEQAKMQEIITEIEFQQLVDAYKLSLDAINVDEFEKL